MPLLGLLNGLQNLSPPFHPPFMDGPVRENWTGWFQALEVSEVVALVEAPKRRSLVERELPGTAA